MLILLSTGNTPGAPTGYGSQSLHLVQGFVAAGHDVIVLSWTFQPTEEMTNQILPTSFMLGAFPPLDRMLTDAEKEIWENKVRFIGNPLRKWPTPIPKDVLNTAICDVGADWIVCLQDIFLIQRGPFFCRSAVYMPIHFTPIEHKTIMSLNDFDVLVAMSAWGQSIMQTVFGPAPKRWAFPDLPKRVELIPHARDPNVFKPLSGALKKKRTTTFVGRKAELREELGWPKHAFITLIVSANSEPSNRKAFDVQLAAWCAFAQERDGDGFDHDDTFLHIHTRAQGEMDIGRLMEIFGEYPNRLINLANPDARTFIDNGGLRGERWSVTPAERLGLCTDAEMVRMYQAADVLLNATCSEGFGVPILEAQLCGTPVITNKTTAMPEITKYGVSVPPAQWIMRNDFVSGWEMPHRDGIKSALHDIASWGHTKRATALQRILPELQCEYATSTLQTRWNDLVEHNTRLPRLRERIIELGQTYHRQAVQTKAMTQLLQTQNEEQAQLQAKMWRMEGARDAHAFLSARGIGPDESQDFQEQRTSLRERLALVHQRVLKIIHTLRSIDLDHCRTYTLLHSLYEATLTRYNMTIYAGARQAEATGVFPNNC